MYFQQLFDPRLAQFTYIAGCERTKQAVVIDPQRDIDRYFAAVAEDGLEIAAAAETHIHADYLSGVREFAERRALPVFLSAEGGEEWQYRWPKASDAEHHLLRNGDEFEIGTLRIKALHTPGHTPEHLTFLIFDEANDANTAVGACTGDFIFVSNVGRPDLLESASGAGDKLEDATHDLYRSLEYFSQFPDHLQIWPGHGMGSACGKEMSPLRHSTLGYERRVSPAFRALTSKRQFFAFVTEGQPDAPAYFGRMKELNRDGVPLLSRPQPERLGVSALGAFAGRKDVALLDTRPREEYMTAHVPGALLVPFDSTFTTVAGSYVDPGMPVYLLIEEGRLEEAVTDLIRIGLDNVDGFFPPDVFDEYVRMGRETSALRTTDFDEVARHYADGDRHVLDVRSHAEFVDGHIPGATNIAHTRLPLAMDEVPAHGVLYVHCEGGVRSSVAAAFLSRFGYETVAVDDAFNRYENADGPLTVDDDQ